MKKTLIVFTLLLSISSVFTGIKAHSGNINCTPQSPSYPDAITIMTYNIEKRYYKQHGRIIASASPDVVAVQELHEAPHTSNFHKLLAETGIRGVFKTTCLRLDAFNAKYGIALLYNENTVGKPIKITTKRIKKLKGSTDADVKRAYIIAEFRDFIFISAHFANDVNDRLNMASSILSEDFVQNYRKPIYIAGDLNEKPNGEDSRHQAVQLFKQNNFTVLNDTTVEASGKYKHATRASGAMIDLILEYNTNPNRKTEYRDVHPDATYDTSDHLPYIVKVKLK